MDFRPTSRSNLGGSSDTKGVFGHSVVREDLTLGDILEGEGEFVDEVPGLSAVRKDHAQ